LRTAEDKIVECKRKFLPGEQSGARLERGVPWLVHPFLLSKSIAIDILFFGYANLA
jgi:hypothetical protein